MTQKENMINCESDQPQVVGTGLTALDRIYTDGEFATAELGGSCGNILVSLAMLHRQVAPLITLGLDNIGWLLVDEFERAGADIRFVNRSPDIQSPMIAQDLDTLSGQHSFRFTCKETRAEFPRYQPIEHQEVEAAGSALDTCSIFYADRLSSSILGAMKRAHMAGAQIFFEPSDVDENHFDRALELASIIKYSSDRLGSEIDYLVSESPAIAIITHGVDGLDIRKGVQSAWCEAVPAAMVADASGSGDMVSVGLIDWLLSNHSSQHALRIDDLTAGVVAGQHLAAANCAFTGARGLFRDKGPKYARYILHTATLNGCHDYCHHDGE